MTDEQKTEFYRLWRIIWVSQNPSKVPPTQEVFFALLEDFNIFPEELIHWESD